MALTFCQSHRLTLNSAANSYVDIEAISLRKKHVFLDFLAKTMLVIVFNRMLLQQVNQYINHLVH
jgi:hypothetical protein